MVTKEGNSQRKCCLYASDYHLEMILLPYIENKIDESNFVIITQKILSLNWNEKDIEKIEYINKMKQNGKKLNIIINGDYNYVKTVNNTLSLIDINDVEIVDCFCIYDKEVRINEIKRDYKEFINTVRI